MRNIKSFNQVLLALFTLLSINNGYTARLDVVFGTKNDPHLDITHCYHWIDQGSDNYLTYKYDHAQKNKDELTFYTTYSTSNGSVAGAGLYCAKSPSGSYSYGDRLIRVNLVDDVVMLDETTGVKYCGHNGADSTNSTECSSKEWDIKFYSGGGIGNSAWYVIQNPMAVDSWSANSDQIIDDLNTSISLNDSSFGGHARSAISAINAERKKIGEKTYYNQNARLSIIDLILNNPEKLSLMPPLNIVARVASDKSNRLTDEKRDEVLKKYLLAALMSDEITYSDFKDVFKKSESLKSMFISSVKTSLADISKRNANIIAKAIVKFPESFDSIVSETHYRQLVDRIFSNKFHFNNLSSSDIELNNKLQKHFAIKLASFESKSLDFDLTAGLPKIIEKVYSDRYASIKENLWKNKIFSNAASSVSLVLGGEEFRVPESKVNILNYCNSAFEFAKDKSSVSIKVNSSQMTLFKSGSSFTKDAACKLVTDNWDAIVDTESIEYGSELFILRGKMETHQFVMLGSTREQISNSCRDFYGSIASIGDIDDINFTINGGDKKVLRNSDSYWKNIDTTCREVNNAIIGVVPSISELKRQREFENKKKEFEENNKGKKLFYVTGLIETSSYLFYGENSDEIIAQCQDFYSEVENKSSVDDITYSVQGSKDKTLRNSSSYWTSKDQVCGQIITVIRSAVPSKFSIDTARGFKLAKIRFKNQGKELYSIKGNIEGIDYIFYGENADEIVNQCKSLYSDIPLNSSVDEIFYIDSNDKEQRLYNSSSYWKNKTSICEQFLTIAKSLNILTLKEQTQKREYEKHISDFNRLNVNDDMLLLLVRYEESEKFIYYGKTRDQIVGMCEDQYSELSNTKIDDIFYTLPNEDEKRLYNSSSFWDSKSQLCSQIDMLLKKTLDSQKEIKFKANRATYLSSNKQLQKTSSAPYQVTGTIGDWEFFMHGEHAEAVRTSCIEFFDNVIGTDYQTKASFKIFDKSFNISNRYKWSSSDSFCDDLVNKASDTILNMAAIKRKENLVIAKSLYSSEYLSSARANYNDAKDIRYKLEVSIGAFSYYLTVNSHDEVYNQCLDLSKYELMFDNKNSLAFKVNKTKSYNLSAKNSSSWENTQSLCRQLSEGLKEHLFKESEIKAKIELENSNFKHKVYGKINTDRFFWVGRHQEDIISKCNAFSVKHINGSRYQALELNVNGTDIGDYNINEEDLCSELSTQIASSVPTKLEYDRRTFVAEYSGNSKKYKLYIHVESRDNPELNDIYLGLNSRDEFINKCHDYFPTLNLPDRRKIKGSIRVNNGEEKSFKLKHATDSANIFCKKMEGELIESIDSSATIESLSNYNDSSLPLKVKGKLGETKFYLYARDNTDIKDQCLDQFDRLYDENLGQRVKFLYYSSSTGEDGRIRIRRRGYSKNDICSSLVEEI